MKPEDAFIGVVEFFSTLVPGAVLAYVLAPLVSPPESWLSFAIGSAEAWALFLISAYLLGHVINAIASAALDKPLYDGLYVPWKRVRLEEGSRSAWRTVLRKRGDGEPPFVCDDPLLAAAKQLKREQLAVVSAKTDLDPLDISDAFWWAVTMVSLQTPQGAHDVNRTIAQSKLFRALSFVAPVAVFSMWWAMEAGMRAYTAPAAVVTAAALSLFCLWSFCRLRWDACERAYEYFIALTCIDARGTTAKTAEIGGPTLV